MNDWTHDREAKARAEMESTAVGRGTALVLLACWIVALAVPPLWDQLTADERPSFAVTLPQARAALAAEGFFAANRELLASMDSLERGLERDSALSAAVQPPLQWFLTAVLGAGNEQVYPGREGWLFLRDGVDHLTGPGFLEPRHLAGRRRGGPSWEAPPRPDPRPAIRALARDLETRGIRLLVMPVPTKAAILPRRLAPGAEAQPPLDNPSSAAFRHWLEAERVPFFDPAPVLAAAAREGEPVFLQADTHWRPEALERVAQELAHRVEAMLGSPEVPAACARQAVQVRHVGDLAALLRLPEGERWRLFEPEAVIVHQVSDLDGRLWRPTPGGEVLLLGDSFANVYSQGELGWGRAAGLAEQLSCLLGRPLDRIAVNGGGADAVRRRLAERIAESRAKGEAPLGGTRLVIYQFAARELSAGDWVEVEM